MSEMKTPSSKWFVSGEKDPHEGKYDCERYELTLGNLTDDELANEVFMWGDHKPSVKELLSGNAKISTHYLTAGKERIRWLSRKNNSLTEENQKLREMLSVMTGFYGSSLKDEGIEPTSCNNYVKAKQLLEQTK